MTDLRFLYFRSNQGKKGLLPGPMNGVTFRPTPIGLTPNFLSVDPNEKARCTFHHRRPILGEIPPLNASLKGAPFGSLMACFQRRDGQ